jgi:tetratricopeptide (TPR) repeat protein
MKAARRTARGITPENSHGTEVMLARYPIAALSFATFAVVGAMAVLGHDAWQADRRAPTETPVSPARYFEPQGRLRPLTPADAEAVPVFYAGDAGGQSARRGVFEWQSSGPLLPPASPERDSGPDLDAPAPVFPDSRLLREAAPKAPIVRLPPVPKEPPAARATRPALPSRQAPPPGRTQAAPRSPLRLPPVVPTLPPIKRNDARRNDDDPLKNPSPMPTMRPDEPVEEDTTPRTADARPAASARPKRSSVHPPFARGSAAAGPTLAAPLAPLSPARRPATNGQAAEPRAAPSPPSGDVARERPPAALPPSGVAVAVARMADDEIRRGFDLAGRGAFFSARESFLKSLRIVAEAHDVEKNQTTHGAALAAALRALAESDELLPTGTGMEADINVASIVSAHRTPVYKDRSTDNVTAMQARRAYYEFAQAQLALAADQEPIGSMALYALGKLHAETAGRNKPLVPGAEAKALVYQQAAVLVSPDNFMAANELGVLLARGGRPEDARGWLLHSAELSGQPTAWGNLAAVHRQLGEKELAEKADQQARRLAQGGPGGRSYAPSVKWIEPQEFANQMRVEGSNQQPSPSEQPRAVAAPASARQLAPSGGQRK